MTTMPASSRFELCLNGVRADELKRMARRWGAPGPLPKTAALAVVRAGLADPRRVAGVLAGLEPFGRTALALLRAMGGELDAAALALAVRAAGCAMPPSRYARQESPADWLQPLADDGLLLADNPYSPLQISDYYSFGHSTLVFSDARLLLPSLRPEPTPLALESEAPPPAASARRPQSVLLDLMSVLQAVSDMGGLRLTQKGSFYLPELRKVGKLLGWSAVLDVDGLPFPAPVRAVVTALGRSGLLSLEQGRLVPAHSIGQLSLRPSHEPVTALLRGFLTAGEWCEWPAGTDGCPGYRGSNYVRARGALWGALLALPEAGDGFFSLSSLSRALFARVGEWVALDRQPIRPSEYGLRGEELRLATARWQTSLAASWEKHEAAWLESAFRTWLYWLGLVEIGTGGGVVSTFRLTELGRAVLLQPPRAASANDAPVASGPAWVVQPDFEVTVYLERATPRQLALLERWAERRQVQRHVVQYRLTREAVYRGLEAGNPLDELLDGLRAGNDRELPQNISAELRGWAARREQITLHRSACLLEFATAAEREAALAAAQLDGEPVGERFLLLRAAVGTAEPEVKIKLRARFRYDQPLPACLSVSARGALRVTTRHTDLLLRSELDAWATPVGNDGWQLTAASIGAAVAAGCQTDELFALLQERLVEPLPPALGLALRTWAGQPQGIVLAKAVILRCPQREVLDAVAQDPDVKSCILARLGACAVLVDPTRLRELRKALRWAGLTIEE